MNNCFHTKKILLLMALAFSSACLSAQSPRTIPASYSSTINKSYVRTWMATAPEQVPNTLITRPLRDVKQTTQYVDGLGRPLQTVVKQGSYPTGGSAVDMTGMVEYDAYGREPFKYLPSPANNTGSNTSITDGNFKLNPFAQQATFYSDNTNGPIKNQGETFYYAQTNFEASPLNRVQETAAPGNSWTGTMWNTTEANRRSVKTKYYVNTATDAVRIWNVTVGTTGSFSAYASPGFYGAGLLHKTITADEHNKQVIEFKDKEGKVILKKVQLTATADDGTGKDHSGWLCTYYLYDDLNNLRCVIQPRGVELISSNWTLNNATILAEQCFRYEYDERNRMIIKKVPGAGEVYMVYDARDRLVMTQDANLRTNNKWLVTLYDGQNRLELSGLLLNTWNNNSFAQHRAAAYNSSSYPFTSSSLPSLTYWDEMTRTFYDNYDWLASNGNVFSAERYHGDDGSFLTADNNQYPYAQPLTQNSQTTGMVTGTKIKILGTSSQYLYSINYYDDKGRILQTQAYNVTNGWSAVTNQYNFSGQVLVNYNLHSDINPGATQASGILTKNDYDDLGRLITVRKYIYTPNGVGNTGEKIIIQNEYDALGQLKKKKLAPGYNSNAGLEALNHDYNIRGWLLGANRDYAKDGNNTNYFGFDLGYDKANNGIIGSQTYANPQYNGNIEGMVWKSKGDGEKRKYDFTYDAANRLLKADFTQYTGGTFNQNAGVNFNIKMGDGANPVLAYDANGNIKQIQQWGLKVTGSTQIDNLAYSYLNSNYSNKLQAVTDANNDNASKLGDFKYDAATKTATDYSYDANGNLIADNNKKISNITYNFLNLPEIITTPKGTITYTYDASGNKLKKVTQENSTSFAYNGSNYTTDITTTTIYINSSGAVYESKSYSNSSLSSLNYPDRLQFIPHEEGRVRFKQSDGSFQFDYFLKDHLGNVRMVLTEEQEQNIYPAATLEGTYSDANTAIGYEKNFYTINTANVVDKSMASGITDYVNNNGISNPYPSGNSGNTNVNANSAKVYKLLATTGGGVNGLGITLKVMSGDKIDIMGKSYYPSANSGGLNYSIPVLDILTGLLGAPGSSAAAKGYSAADLNGQSGITSPVSSFLSDAGRGSGTIPKAYINWILFDENFKYVNGSFSRVGTAGTVKSHYGDASMQNIQVTKNGYLYVYVSNESPVAVFFDNLQVVHTRGPLLEETHYYPFGLTMNGISSKTLKSNYAENKIKLFGKELQSKEFSDGSGLEWYDYGMREYDQQIGRFFRIDPISEKFFELSAYQYCSNNPIKNVDLDGAEGLDFRIFTKLVENTVKNPNGTSAKVLGAVTGVGGAVQGAITGTANAIAHPIQTAKGLGHMLSQSTEQNATDYAVSLYSQYGNSGSNTFTDYAVGAHLFTDMAMSASAMKGVFPGKTTSVWDLASSPRGFAIEAKLGGNLPKAFPVIDKLADGVASSIKSIDLTASSYNKGNGLLNTLKGYINKLDDFTEGSRGKLTLTEGVDFTSKALEIAIQPGKATLKQWEQIADAMKYAQDKGIQFNINFIK